ncbi:MAG: MauE/DoxX family redox-associated membrane protein [Candidatus Eisenbacteria bacterium]|nr:MauE/DoxX family redox-associated membrane protein [Candidatus Eisenbacteria bacterium]
MSRASLSTWIAWILRLGLAGVYLFAAIPKIADPWSFSRAIFNFRILPQSLVPAVALWLPPLELLAALAILIGIFRRGGLAWLTALSAAFAIAIVSAMARGLDIDCGCFGAAASSRASWSHLALNVSTLGAGAFLLARDGRPSRRQRRPFASPRRRRRGA